jgi:hypothetical protein
MRTITSILSAVLFVSVAACGGAPDDPTGSGENALDNAPGAVGDNCSIDLPNGTKEPGTETKDGKCCSVFDAKKCVDLPKAPAPTPAPASSGWGIGVGRVGGVGGRVGR